MKVLTVVGGPVHNRAWILPRTLDHLSKLRGDITYLFLDDCSTDGSLQILSDWCNQTQRTGSALAVSAGIEMPVPRWDRSDPALDAEKKPAAYQHLADLRNLWVSKALELHQDATHLLSVDSDVLVRPGTLERLLGHGKDIVSALICNDARARYYNVMVKTPDAKYHHVQPAALFGHQGLFPCSVTGACMLISRAVLDAGVRWGVHRVGEDAAFGDAAIAAGFTLWCDTQYQLRHVLSQKGT